VYNIIEYVTYNNPSSLALHNLLLFGISRTCHKKRNYSNVIIVLCTIISSVMTSRWAYFMGAHMPHFTLVHLPISPTPKHIFRRCSGPTVSSHCHAGPARRQLTLLPPPASLAHSLPRQLGIKLIPNPAHQTHAKLRPRLVSQIHSKFYYAKKKFPSHQNIDICIKY
jgi:hypothetical protein